VQNIILHYGGALRNWGLVYTRGMQRILVLSIFVAAFSVKAEVPPRLQKFEIKKPTPQWFCERLDLPPKGFAPDLGLTGVEEILFAPGMFKATEKDFFSYVFLFALEPKPELTAEVLRKQLLVYYTGLSKARLGQPKLDVSKFSVKLLPLKLQEQSPEGALQSKFYRAEVKWIEPFATKKFQTLHFELQTWKYAKSKYNYLFVCASPQTRDKPIWKTLREIRASVKLKKK